MLHCNHGVGHLGHGTGSSLLSQSPLPATVQTARLKGSRTWEFSSLCKNVRGQAERTKQALGLTTSNHYQEALCLTHATVSTHNPILRAHTPSLALAVARPRHNDTSIYTWVFNSLPATKTRAP